MRPSLRKIGLLCIVAGMTACVSCNSSGFLPFPKTVAWTQRTVDSAANVRPTAVVVADFDGDGLVDIVAGYPGTDTVTAAVFIFFQTDVDNFTGVLLAGHTDLTGLAALAVADLDADGQSDVVAASILTICVPLLPALLWPLGRWIRSRPPGQAPSEPSP